MVGSQHPTSLPHDRAVPNGMDITGAPAHRLGVAKRAYKCGGYAAQLLGEASWRLLNTNPQEPVTMTTPESAHARDEVQLRHLIADQMRAICAKDLDELMHPYAAEVVVFDVKPPFQTTGADAWRRRWEACLPYVLGRLPDRDARPQPHGQRRRGSWPTGCGVSRAWPRTIQPCRPGCEAPLVTGGVRADGRSCTSTPP